MIFYVGWPLDVDMICSSDCCCQPTLKPNRFLYSHSLRRAKSPSRRVVVRFDEKSRVVGSIEEKFCAARSCIVAGAHHPASPTVICSIIHTLDTSRTSASCCNVCHWNLISWWVVKFTKKFLVQRTLRCPSPTSDSTFSLPLLALLFICSLFVCLFVLFDERRTVRSKGRVTLTTRIVKSRKMNEERGN